MTAPRRTSAAKGQRRPSVRQPLRQPRQSTLLEAPASEPVLAPSDPPSETSEPGRCSTSSDEGSASAQRRSGALSTSNTVPKSIYRTSVFRAPRLNPERGFTVRRERRAIISTYVQSCRKALVGLTRREALRPALRPFRAQIAAYA